MNAATEGDTSAIGGGQPDVSFGQALRVWARIGVMSFGGPAGQIALMHRILVEEKRWIDEARFLHALNFCMLLPGPEAQQLATYVGWLLHRIRGGLIAGTLFILPGFAVILGLSFLYVKAASLTFVEGLFAGLKAAVVVIVLQAVIRIGRRSIRSAVPALLAILALLAMFVFRVPFPWVILGAAMVGAGSAMTRNAASGDAAPAEVEPRGFGAGYVLRCVTVFGGLWLAPSAALVILLGPDDVFTSISVFFSKMAVVTFGGAYAVLAYVSQEAVVTHGWLAPGEMIDGLAMAETTPGPLILVTQFVGFMAAYRSRGMLPAELAAVLGALLTVWVTFVPCFLWIFAGAPFVERLRHNRLLAGALAGVTAAVVGVIVNLALWFSMHAIFNAVTARQIAGLVIELPVLATVRIDALFIIAVAAVLTFRYRTTVMTTLAVAGGLGVLTVVL